MCPHATIFWHVIFFFAGMRASGREGSRTGVARGGTLTLVTSIKVYVCSKAVVKQ